MLNESGVAAGVALVEVVEENPSEFSWRIVHRGKDTNAEIGAPIYGQDFYRDPASARRAGEQALKALLAESLPISPPSATG